MNGLAATIATGEGTRYVTADTLGTPRIVTSTTGAVISRHDYEPFGAELFVGMGSRTSAQGYSSESDSLRQKFTGKERDNETGLDYFGARYYGSTEGRFTSLDPLDPVLGKQGADDREEAGKQFQAYLAEPQRWNRYTCSLNNPLRYVDPDGFDPLVVIASSVAFRMLEAARYGSNTEGVSDPNASINLNIREMILDMWQDYYQWWLSIFVGLCMLRFLIIFVSNRVSNSYKLK